MQIEIEGRHKNPLLHREELNFELLDTKKIPDRKALRTQLAAQLGADENLIIVEHIEHTFGTSRIVGSAKRYDTIEDLKKIESAHNLKRHGLEEPKKEAAAAPPAASE